MLVRARNGGRLRGNPVLSGTKESNGSSATSACDATQYRYLVDTTECRGYNLLMSNTTNTQAKNTNSIEKRTRRARVWIDTTPHAPSHITILYSEDQEDAVAEFLRKSICVVREDHFAGEYELLSHTDDA